MKAAILTIGDELLIGQVLNSNTQWMSQQLTDIGIDVTTQLTVHDRIADIQGALTFLLQHNEIILIGGGLGPTHDDLTMEALASFFKRELVFDQDWLTQVEGFFRARNRAMSDNNRKQAFLLKGATRIDNDCGTAAGQFIEQGSHKVFVFPGVPHEMKSMMKRFILPQLAARNPGQKILKETLHTTGVGESALATRLDPFVKKVQADPRLSLAFLPNHYEVRLRLQMTSQSAQDEIDFHELVGNLKEECGQDFFGFGEQTLEKVVTEQLIASGKTLALAESCTGGLIAHKITQIEGSSKALKGALVCYQNEIKTLDLGISSETFAEVGVVSKTVVEKMATAIRIKWDSDFALATTGYLGPTGDHFTPGGTVWIAFASRTEVVGVKLQLETNRERSKERAAQAALDLFRRHAF